MRAQAFFSSSTLQLMKATMSGWSALRMTIFAARRVLPPDLMTPANASKPFMNDTGPDAVPPPASSSLDDRGPGGGERPQIVFAREVLLRGGPPGDRINDAADELLPAPLTLRRPERSAEVLGDDDVGGLLGPELGNLDVE